MSGPRWLLRVSGFACLSLRRLICRMGIMADILDNAGQIQGKATEACCTAFRWETLEMREWTLSSQVAEAVLGSKGRWPA